VDCLFGQSTFFYTFGGLRNTYLILHLLLLKEKECSSYIYNNIAPLLKERGWGEVNPKWQGGRGKSIWSRI
jgi:hypothetical protein